MGKFVISKTKNGEFTFSLKAGNGEIILTASESYTSMSGCQGASLPCRRTPWPTWRTRRWRASRS